MSIEWLLYLIDVLESLNGCVVTFSVISNIVLMIFLAAFAIFYVENNLENKIKRFKDFSKVLVPIVIISTTLSVLIPSKKTMYAIALAHYSKQSDIPAKVFKAIEVKLDEVIEGVKK